MTERPESNLDNADSRRLASIVDLDPSADRVWHPEELGAILRHQLAVPIQFDLAGLAPGAAKKLATLSAASGLLLQSLADLLAHPAPPVELLVMLKDFAKANAAHRDSALPSDVAKVVYLLTIAAALVRCGQRITSVSDAELAAGLTWASNQHWLEPRERSLLSQALAKVKAQGQR
ncbi:hypothetical protein [Fontivita pretiosa]|uniref:hypothetical protein n=1 Tax=Fontivita pretiosa TaxID=2989684 RepID=UPI003D17C1DD